MLNFCWMGVFTMRVYNLYYFLVVVRLMMCVCFYDACMHLDHCRGVGLEFSLLWGYQYFLSVSEFIMCG